MARSTRRSIQEEPQVSRTLSSIRASARNVLLFYSLAAVLGALALASGPTRAEDAKRPGEPVGRTPISFKTPDGRDFSYALVSVQIRGEQTWMLLDTGSTHHVLARWFADSLGLEARAATGRPGKGHMGEPVEVELAEPEVLQIEGWEAQTVKSLLVINLPQVFTDLKIGGILSPQRLIEGQSALILDLPAAEMRAAPSALAVDSAPFAFRGEVDSCAAPARASIAPRHVVQAEVGSARAKLAIDTGASRTGLKGASHAARMLSVAGGESRVTTSAGGTFEVRSARTRLIVGTIEREMKVDITPAELDAECPYDGVLGMDVLRGCELRIDRTSTAVRCDP